MSSIGQVLGNIRLKVEPTQLVAQADEVSKNVRKMEKLFEEMNGVINRTESYWIGEAGDLHRKLYRDEKDDIDQIVRRFKEHPKDLQLMAQEYTNAETAASSVASALPQDVIE